MIVLIPISTNALLLVAGFTVAHASPLRLVATSAR
jgi:hypothetical protein